MAKIGALTRTTGTGVVRGAGRTGRSLTTVSNNLDTISPGMSSIIKTVEPLQTRKFQSLAKRDKRKAAGVVTALLGAGIIGSEAISTLSSSSDTSIAQFGAEIYDEVAGFFVSGDSKDEAVIDQEEDSLGEYDDLVPEAFDVGTDGEVVGQDVKALEYSLDVVDAGTEAFLNARSAVGGADRLAALTAWMHLDPDLRDLIVRRSTR